MMRTDTLLARTAVREALKVRRGLGIDRAAPLCVFDIAERLDVEVKFREEKSLEGMYFNLEQPVILISAHRPPGRQAYTCAHELGHHVLGHGTRVDKYVEDARVKSSRDPEERAADSFAANLLMPAAVVKAAFQARGWTPSSSNPLQVYTVAMYLGVGYETLITQMTTSLSLITEDRVGTLRKMTPKMIRRAVLGDDSSNHLVIADHAWNSGAVAIDLSTTDAVVLPTDIEIEGSNIRIEREVPAGKVAIAQRQGICHVTTPDRQWNAFVRVSRRIDGTCAFVGRSIFRHDEDPDAN